jgi:hypothetical protein
MSANHGQRRIEDTMLSDLLTVYREEGFVVIPDVFSAAELTELRAVTDEFVRNAAQVSANDVLNVNN